MNGILYITGALADGGVTTAKLADDAVTDAKLANSINSAIAANTAKNTNATHTGDVTGSGSLTIANNAVTTAKIADGAISESKIASQVVTNGKIANNAITNTRIQDNAITAAKIQDQAITLAKLPHGDGSSDGKFLRANNGADPSFETVSIPAGTTINNNADNRVITGSGTANTLNGESTFVYDTSENGVGIGISDPSPTATYYQGAFLHVHQAASGSSVGSQLRLTTDNTGTATGDGSQISAYSTSLYINNQENGSTYFYNNGSATATITSAGNFGINTQSPTDKLHVNGTALVGSNFYVNGNTYLASSQGIYFDGGSSTANHLDDYEEGTHSTTDQSGAGLSIAGSVTYVKIGRQVQVLFDITWPSTSHGGQASFSLPFSASVYGSGIVGWCTDPTQCHIAGSVCSLMDSDSSKHKTNNQISGQRFIGECIYFVNT